MAAGEAVGFEPLRRDHLPLLYEWFQREHVRRWWGERLTLEAVETRYLPRIDGSDPTDVYLITLDGRPVGLIQTYMAQGVSGIAIAPLSKDASIANLKQAADKGIKIAITNMSINDTSFLSGGYTSDDAT